MKRYPIATLPIRKQKQVVMKKPTMTYEFISRKDVERFGEFARQAWLLGLHENGYLHNILQAIYLSYDNWRNWGGIGQFDFVVARADDAIVGIILHEAAPSTIDTYVIPSWRRRGVASGMVKALRGFIGDSKVLCGWTGVEGQGWENYYARNFILYLDVATPKELIDKHGCKETADAAYRKSRKLKMAAAYRKSKAEA